VKRRFFGLIAKPLSRLCLLRPNRYGADFSESDDTEVKPSQSTKEKMQESDDPKPTSIAESPPSKVQEADDSPPSNPKPSSIVESVPWAGFQSTRVWQSPPGDESRKYCLLSRGNFPKRITVEPFMGQWRVDIRKVR
jgi:hypothetical protein